MNSFLRQMSLPARLMLIAFLPLVFFIYLALQVYKDKIEKIDILGEHLKRINSSFIISALIDELQTERRYAFGYVIKKDWQAQLLLQRAKTDDAYNKLQDSTDEMLVGFTGYTMLNRLKDIRQKVDENRLEPEEVMNYYTNTIFRLDNLNNISGGNIVFLQPVNKEIAGQKLLSDLITYMGILRADLYYNLYKKTSSAQIITRLHGLYDLYNTFQTEFLIKASDATIYKYNKIRNRGDLKTTVQYLDNIFYKGKIDSDFDPERWWTVSANGVDEIKSLQRNLLKQINQSVRKIYDEENANKKKTLILLVIGLLGVVFLVLFTIRVLNKTLNELKTAAQKISEGAIGVTLSVRADDVIGNLANSILKIDKNNKILADQADAIGQGNFDVVITPRSDEDVLAASIKKMKRSLRHFNKEARDKIWIHTGIEAVNKSIAGEKEVKSLASDALNALVTYLGREIGLFYSLQNDVLVYAAGYAVPDMASVPFIIKLGETLMGQAALKKEIVQLNDLPEDYMLIKSAAGNAKPKNIMIIPLVRGEVVEGVIEIGSLYEFNDLTVSLVEQVRHNITIALQTAKNRMRLQELLEQTQAQSEELKMQHNELENVNTELELQAQKLQASEEELKVQQQELMQTNQQLEERTKIVEERNQLIVERNIEIQQKAHELGLSTKYKSEFLANMSHELRTPLNSILLLSRLLAENTHQNLSGEQVEYAKVIQSSGNGLLVLIDEILDLSKIEAGKMELEFAEVPVNSITDDLGSLFMPVAKDKKIIFTINVDANVPASIQTDKMRLEQVLKNLLSNSLKFTSKGSVSLDISAPSDNEAFVTFSVKDTGIGIAKEKQQQIFEAFQQEDGSTRRQFGGTGLGLSISREFTRLLGGEIKLISEQGKGSEFIVRIPKVKRAEVRKDKNPENLFISDFTEETKKQDKENGVSNFTTSFTPAVDDDRSRISVSDKVILIVEDDVNFVNALLYFIRKKGYKTIVALRGDEGIALAKKYRPAGILLDIQLPVKDGWAVMEELKTDASTRHIPVHIMSAYAAEKESLQKGAVDFISKPITADRFEEVFEKIEQVIIRQGKKVLIIEEDTRHAKALSYFLETFNITSEIAPGIADAVAGLKVEETNCVILDIGIPDTNALETIEAIRKKSAIENLPVIIFTGKNLSKGEEQKIKQYANSIIIKTASAYRRVLDEVSLFLHMMEQNKQAAKSQNFGALYEVLANKKILIADDDIRNIFSLTKALEQNRMNVLSAMDGEEALQLLHQNTDVDIVLMDIMMPVMDGYQATKKIRENNKFKNLPVIAVTAKAMTGDREKCIEAGASDYISKPVDIDQLLSLLRVWLYE